MTPTKSFCLLLIIASLGAGCFKTSSNSIAESFQYECSDKKTFNVPKEGALIQYCNTEILLPKDTFRTDAKVTLTKLARAPVRYESFIDTVAKKVTIHEWEEKTPPFLIESDTQDLGNVTILFRTHLTKEQMLSDTRGESEDTEGNRQLAGCETRGNLLTCAVNIKNTPSLAQVSQAHKRHFSFWSFVRHTWHTFTRTVTHPQSIINTIANEAKEQEEHIQDEATNLVSALKSGNLCEIGSIVTKQEMKPITAALKVLGDGSACPSVTQICEDLLHCLITKEALPCRCPAGIDVAALIEKAECVALATEAPPSLKTAVVNVLENAAFCTAAQLVDQYTIPGPQECFNFFGDPFCYNIPAEQICTLAVDTACNFIVGQVNQQSGADVNSIANQACQDVLHAPATFFSKYCPSL